MKLVDKLFQLVEGGDLTKSTKERVESLLKRRGFELSPIISGYDSHQKLYYLSPSGKVDTGAVFNFHDDGSIRVEATTITKKSLPGLPRELERFIVNASGQRPALEFPSIPHFVRVFPSLEKVLLAAVRDSISLDKVFERIVSEAEKVAREKGFKLKWSSHPGSGLLELHLSKDSDPLFTIKVEIWDLPKYGRGTGSSFSFRSYGYSDYVNTKVFKRLPDLVPGVLETTESSGAHKLFYVVKWRSLDGLVSGFPKVLDLVLR